MLLRMLFNVFLLGAPVILFWIMLQYGYPQMHLDLDDYLTIFQWGHL